MKNHQLINQTSGDVEIYTPSTIIEAASLTMGYIDLDPASSFQANKSVNASGICCAPDFQIQSVDPAGIPFRKYTGLGGLDHKWHGRIWLNHPFGSPIPACSVDCNKESCRKRGFHVVDYFPGNSDWVKKACHEYESGRAKEICMITFASTSEAWFRPLLAQPQCFLWPRTNYLRSDGTIYRGVTKGSVVTYFGRNPSRFAECFQHLGTVKEACPA